MRMLDITSIAELMGLNAAHVRDRLTKRADFPAGYRLGGTLRWKADDIADWIESRKVTPAARRPKKRRAQSSMRDANVPTSGA